MIGWYIHHQGQGHLATAAAIAPHLSEPVTALSSLPRPANWSGQWVSLDRDDDDIVGTDRTAYGAFHWVPRHHRGLSARMATIASWIDQHRPSVMVIDVSVEVTVLSRLCGIPVVVIALPGDRSDRPHQLAYDMADRLIAPWRPDTGTLNWPRRWVDKAAFVGGISRFDGRARPLANDVHGSSVLVLWGSGGRDTTDDELTEAQAATPDWTWTARGPQNPSPDLWSELHAASVVVGHAGLGVVADIAAARRPAVIIAQHRPFGEQHATARTLCAQQIAIGLPQWPAAQRWPSILQAAIRLGGEQWSWWSSGDGPARAASIITETARHVTGSNS